jgi:hypothetical protein
MNIGLITTTTKIGDPDVISVGKPITVSADRVKPAYIFNEDDCGSTSLKPATTASPPVICRLAPGRFAIAKAEFDSMLRDDTARRSESSWFSALHIVPKKDNGWRSALCSHRRDANRCPSWVQYIEQRTKNSWSRELRHLATWSRIPLWQ